MRSLIFLILLSSSLFAAADKPGCAESPAQCAQESEQPRLEPSAALPSNISQFRLQFLDANIGFDEQPVNDQWLAEIITVSIDGAE